MNFRSNTHRDQFVATCIITSIILLASGMVYMWITGDIESNTFCQERGYKSSKVGIFGSNCPIIQGISTTECINYSESLDTIDMKCFKRGTL